MRSIWSGGKSNQHSSLVDVITGRPQPVHSWSMNEYQGFLFVFYNTRHCFGLQSFQHRGNLFPPGLSIRDHAKKMCGILRDSCPPLDGIPLQTLVSAMRLLIWISCSVHSFVKEISVFNSFCVLYFQYLGRWTSSQWPEGERRISSWAGKNRNKWTAFLSATP